MASDLTMATKFQCDKRVFSLGVGLTIIHAICVLGSGVVAFTLNGTNLDNPAPPSPVGRGLSVVASVLGFPLLTLSDFFLLRLASDSWQSAILRSPIVLGVNSIIWGFGVALLWRRLRGEAHA